MFSKLFFVFLFIDQCSTLFFRSKVVEKAKDCCQMPNVVVDSTKSNRGRDFFRQTFVESNFGTNFTPENLCDFLHFLFQQTKIEKKTKDAVQRMFILYDSTRQIFNKIVPQDQRERKTTTTINQTLGLIENDRYPLYGVNLPKICAPSDFDQIILGELPPVSNVPKYEGQRFFIKPGRFGFEHPRYSSIIRNPTGFLKEILQSGKCRTLRLKSQIECTKLRAFKKNTDKIMLKKWKKILKQLPKKSRINIQNNKIRAIKYGIAEIYQQATDLEAAGAGRAVKNFRRILMKTYPNDDIVVRKGRENILTINALKESPPACSPSINLKKCK